MWTGLECADGQMDARLAAAGRGGFAGGQESGSYVSVGDRFGFLFTSTVGQIFNEGKARTGEKVEKDVKVRFI